MDKISRAEELEQKRSFWKTAHRQLARGGFKPGRILPETQSEAPTTGENLENIGKGFDILT